MSVFLAVKCPPVADTQEEAEDSAVLIEFRSWFGLQLSILRTNFEISGVQLILVFVGAMP